MENGQNIPRHIAIIMDGNGRWAKKRGMARLFGHRAGADAVRRVLGYCRKYSVKYLTLYAFSTENWSRPKAEVEGLMKLLERFLADNEEDLVRDKCRLRVMGRRSDLPAKALERIEKAEERTKEFDSTLTLCLSYGGRAEIADAASRLVGDVRSGRFAGTDVDEKTFAEYLYAPDLPDPDLIVRTSGELRLSNFLLWQAAYSELYVTDVLWPDFSEEDFLKALEAYSHRVRKFGGLV